MLSKNSISGIILAGGKSSRMGQNKASLIFNGMSLAQWQIQKLRKLGISEVLVSGYGAGMIPDEIPDKGPLGGIYTGLKKASGEQCLILPVDVPLIPENLLRDLIDAHCGGITIIDNKGYLEPIIGIYDSDLAPVIHEILMENRTSVRILLDKVGYKTVSYTGDKSLLANCNTPEELERIRRSSRLMTSK